MVDENQTKPAMLTEKLAQEEKEHVRQANIEHVKKISRVTLAIEKLLIEEDMTWGDFGEIAQTLHVRSTTVFAGTKIKSIKESYGSHL